MAESREEEGTVVGVGRKEREGGREGGRGKERILKVTSQERREGRVG